MQEVRTNNQLKQYPTLKERGLLEARWLRERGVRKQDHPLMHDKEHLVLQRRQIGCLEPSKSDYHYKPGDGQTIFKASLI
jgi:hypothetical protein